MANTETTAEPPHHALLARLEAERAHHEECATLSRIDETRIAHSSMAAGLHLAALRLVEVFEGPEVAAEYMQRTTPKFAPVVVAEDREPEPDDGLRKQTGQLAAVLREVLDQFCDWPKGGTPWPDGGVVAKVPTETWDRWDAIAAQAVESSREAS